MTQHKIVLPVNPVPASRPRVGRWGTYYSATYKNYMAAVAKHFEANPTALHFSSPIRVVVHCFIEKPRTSKLSRPRGDVDNLAKAALDVLTHAGVWVDDELIDHLTVTKQFCKLGEGRTEIVIEEV